MTAVIVVTALALGTLALKSCGALLAAGRTPPPIVERLIGHLTPALVAALVVTGVVTTGHHLVLDARLPGLVAGGAALLARAPLWLALVAGAATTAGVRLLW